MLCDYNYIKYPEQVNPQRQKNIGGCLGLEEEGWNVEFLIKGAFYSGDKNILEIDSSYYTQHCESSKCH